MDIETLFAME